IDDPWQDGDHVGMDDDKEELGGVPAAIWRGTGVRSPRRALRATDGATVDHFRSAARGHHRSTLSRVDRWTSSAGAGSLEAWEVGLAMKVPHGSWED
ncbi:MAG TPA: hypothetical protein DFR83_16080, partial [Deltaproteobacteria bacterium]|nr:hypothetical protein [Deltaproteobacteria bacterium]